MSNSKKVAIGILNLIFILFLPIVVAGLTVALMGAVVTMLTSVGFHTIMNSALSGVIFFIVWVICLVWVGDCLKKNN